MTTAYTSLLGLALPVTGELSGTWGDTVNTAITSLLDTAIAGTTSITTDADITLSTTTGASNQARQAIILWNPASGTTTRNITAPAQSKMYVVINASGGTQSIVIRGAGPTTGVTIAKGESATVAWNGSDFVKVSSSGGAITFTDLTVTGNTILGDAAADTLTVNATSTFNAPVSFAGLVRLPSTGRSAAAALTVTAPAFLYGVASTYTDTTSSGTIAAMAPFYAIAAPTLSTSNVTTYSFASTLYVAGAPAAGGSATITNPYALYVNSGASYLAGVLGVGGAATFGGTLSTVGAMSSGTSTYTWDTAFSVLKLGDSAAVAGLTNDAIFAANTYYKQSVGWFSIANKPVYIFQSNATADTGFIWQRAPAAGANASVTLATLMNLTTSALNVSLPIATVAPQSTNGQLVIQNSTTRANGNKYGIRFVDSTSETNASIYITQLNAGNNQATMTIAVNDATGGATLTSAKDVLFITPTQVGIGAAPNSPLTVVGANATFAAGIGNLFIYTNTAIAANIGGSIALGGYYTGTTQTQWAGLRGGKNNATDGDYGGYLSFNTRANGSALREVGRFTSASTFLLGTTADYGGMLTIIPRNGNPTSASSTLNQIQIGEASENSAYRLNIGYTFVSGGYRGNIQSIVGGSAGILALNADGGNVGIGTNAPAYVLDVQTGSVNTVARFYNSLAGGNTDIYVNNIGTGGDLLLTRRANGEFWVYQSGAFPINLYTNSTKRFTVDASGRAGFGTIGTTADRYIDMSCAGITLDAGSNQFGVVLNPTYSTGVTATIFNIYAGPNLTAGTTVNNVYSLYLEAINSAGSTVNIGKWGVYQAGTADRNYFAGNVLVGTTNPGNVSSSGNLVVDGAIVNGQTANVNIPYPGTTDMVTFPNGTSGIYLMQGRQSGAPNGGIFAIALVVVGTGTGTLTVTNLTTASMSFGVSATARTVNVTNTAGGTLGTTVSWIRLMGNT